MLIDLDPRETEILDALLEAAISERLHQIHHAHSRDFRKRLEAEAELIERVRAKLTPEHSDA